MRFPTSLRALLTAAIALTALSTGCSGGPAGSDAGRDLTTAETIVFDSRDVAPRARPDVAEPLADVAPADPGHETPSIDLAEPLADLAEPLADLATEAQPDAAPDPGPQDPGGAVDPKACVTDADCTAQGACPSDATRGCTCVTDKNGGKRCKPACAVDADCPTPPDKILVCSADGVCVPQESGPAEPPPEIVEVVDAPPPTDGSPDAAPPTEVVADAPVGPTTCTTSDDCSAPGACPSGATQGCTCVTDNNGDKRCKPACTVDADCPTPPDKILVCSPDGVCVPQG